MELPDPMWNRFFNVWAKQQLAFLGDFTRVYLAGFRDTLQDVQALCAYAPDQVRTTSAGRVLANIRLLPLQSKA